MEFEDRQFGMPPTFAFHEYQLPTADEPGFPGVTYFLQHLVHDFAVPCIPGGF